MNDRVVTACKCRNGGWLRILSWKDMAPCPVCGQPVEDINIDELLRIRAAAERAVITHRMADAWGYDPMDEASSAMGALANILSANKEAGDE